MKLLTYFISLFLLENMGIRWPLIVNCVENKDVSMTIISRMLMSMSRLSLSVAWVIVLLKNSLPPTNLYIDGCILSSRGDSIAGAFCT